jgi:hypothetical protein
LFFLILILVLLSVDCIYYFVNVFVGGVLTAMVKVLSLGTNPLGGELPKSISQLTALRELYLSLSLYQQFANSICYMYLNCVYFCVLLSRS